MEHLEISTDVNRLDVDLIHRFLSEESYWARGRARAVVQQSIDNSLCFGAYVAGQQVGFARVVTDRTTFAWLADVFIVGAHRGRGYGKTLVATILDYPDLRDVRRWLLATKDAHGLYAQNGFTPVPPERFMEWRNPNV
ncbi:MAG: GNAT family N-acetyltransferase [Candidatus Promineofilum sp.]|nr:GNAT family N-acetyltransferase [Promineifilum sp.]